MTKFASVLRTPAALAGLVIVVLSNSAQAALSSSKGTGEEQSGLIWLYFAAFVLVTLGVAFMPSKRKESQE